MTIASIDIGSNTVLLLIARIEQDKIQTVLNKYETPRISKGLQNDGTISQEAINRLIDVLHSYKKLIDEHNCDTVLVNATNAMRIAKNAEEIVSMIKDKFGYDVNIIAGEQEAYYSYLGSTFGQSEHANIVLDIGGGSTEIILGKGKEIVFAESMPIGAVNLTEKHCSSLPPAEIELNNITREIEQTISGLNLIDKIANIDKLRMVAVAGTPTTLSCIKQNLLDYDEGLVEGSELTKDNLLSIEAELAKYNPREVLAKYGNIVRGREDVLLTGTILLKTIADYFSIDNIIASGRGIRYGAVIDFIGSRS